MEKPLAYRSFLLTAWEERRQATEAEPVWRFGLEDVRGTSRRRVFATLEEVMRYVKEELAEATVKSTLLGDKMTIKINDGKGETTPTITSRRNDVLIRRHILEPGEALPWHTDLCHRFTVTIRGDALGIEYRDTGPVEVILVYPGMTGWDEPESKVHRGVNVGKVPYEEVVIFFLSEPDLEPQPEAN